jgi:hypothetical protein
MKSKIKRELQQYSFLEKNYIPQLAIIIIISLAALFLIYISLSKFIHSFISSEALKVFISLAVAIIAYWQWRKNRHEISIDKYYDRLENANKRLECLNTMTNNKMHVFVELDKLEYVKVKYELGFIPPEFAKRAIDNFKCHCKNIQDFKKLVEEIIEESAYLPETKKTVKAIIEECNKKIN